jgi:hypothetical protein
MTSKDDLDECNAWKQQHLGDVIPPRPQAIECPECKGEGGHEGPITCTGRCDWCGGCRDQGERCGTCDGECELEVDGEYCHVHPDAEHCPCCGDEDKDGNALACCFCGFKVVA